MMRIVMIVGALVIGLTGLFMSVCGGGFFITFLFSMATALFRRDAVATAIGMLPMMLLAGGCCVVGGLLVWGCARSIKKWWR